MRYHNHVCHISPEAKRWVLEEFAPLAGGVPVLLQSIRFSAAEVYEDGEHNYYVGPVSMVAALGRAAFRGDIYLDDDLKDEVIQICQIEQAQEVSQMAELIVHSNSKLRQFALAKLDWLLKYSN